MKFANLTLKNGIIAEFKGVDYWDRPYYKFEHHGVVRTVCCTELNGTFLHYYCPRNDTSGEPDYPLPDAFQPEDQEDVPEEPDYRHSYMMLDRYRMNIEYYWGAGGRRENHLYMGSYEQHVREMINLWESLPVKPVWLRATELIQMKNALKAFEEAVNAES